jgi:hypothetical protein
MPSHDSPKTLRGEGKKLDPAKVAAAAEGYNPTPFPAPASK